MNKSSLLLSCAMLLPAGLMAQAPSVHIAPPQLQGSRQLEKQTESSVVRHYLESWKSMQDALNLNDPSKLDPSFVGAARDKLAETIKEQSKAGIHTRYQDRSHDLQIVFYSPEGLSIQMTDNVEYEQQVVEKEKVLSSTVIRRRYVVVLTPSEVRWQVRIFQTSAD